MNAPSKPKPTDQSVDERLPRSRAVDLDVQAAHKRISKRFPKVLAKLGE
jgi:hypothetical protein